jgi:hypothetical protein
MMQAAMCPASPKSILETAVTHAYPEQGRDNRQCGSLLSVCPSKLLVDLGQDRI